MIDYIEVLFGAFLGLGISLFLQFIDSFKMRRKAMKVLKLECPGLSKVLLGYVNISKQMKSISSSPIPNFKLVIQVEYILYLENKTRTSVFKIYQQLEQAENLRIIARPLIGLKGKESEFNAYGELYLSCLTSAKEEMDKLEKSIHN